ncbi:MAG: UDP-N-acetylmuramoylalanine--D-glutamate ligase [marine bacterium B5-7]|nr:MAG: UDP-N-acetylmuramoylalanine--D-glutamate ligase [marine bacterium B5-7]
MNVVSHTMGNDAPSTLVLGLGRSGYSAARYLYRHNEPFELADTRATPPMKDLVVNEFPGVKLHLGQVSDELLGQFERIVLSPGLSKHEPKLVAAAQAGIEILGDIELFSRHAIAPVVAITGSNGKSTVTRMTGDMLEADGYRVRVGGNIGVPALDLLDDDTTTPEFYVLELSSFQLETTHSLKPASAVVLNISADHMDRYADLDAYARAKGYIYAHAAVCVINRDDILAASLCPQSSRQLNFGIDVPRSDDEFGLITKNGRVWLAQGSRMFLAADEVLLEGTHNLANALAALALIAALGIDISKAMLDALKSFRGLVHRMERVADFNGVRFINDSKGTNVGATAAAIAGLDAPIVLIAGGRGKGADFNVLARAASGRIRHLIVFGEDTDAIADAFTKGLGGSLSITRTRTLVEAVDKSFEVNHEGDVVLFSPACASFDQFENFEQRGDRFRELVQRRVAEEAICKP